MSEGYGQPYRDGFGPVLAGRARRRKGGWRRWLLLTLAAVSIFAVGLVATAGALLLRGESQIDRIQVEGIQAAGDIDGDGRVDVEELTEVLNVLVVGSDTREGLSSQQRHALATGEADGVRTDTVMLARIDPGRDQVAIISFPRDLLVERCDGTTGRINSAYGLGESNGTGGASCLVQTVHRFTGIPIQHYVEVNFAGFVDVVDIVGGVTLYLQEPMEDRKAGIDLPAGCVTLDGGDALGFVRTRRYDSDYGRIARQQRFVRELVAEVTSVGTLANVPRLFSLVDAGARSVDADHNLSIGVMRRLAMSLRDLTPDRVVTRTVPAETHVVNGEYAGELPLTEEAEALFRAFRTGELIRPESRGPQERPLAPADVDPLVILNGVGTEGLAGQAEEALEELGFSVTSTGNAESFDLDTTQVRHPPELTDQAELVADALGGAAVTTAEPGTRLEVVLGADFDAGRIALDGDPPAAISPTPTPTATGTPTPEPSPTPTYRGAQPADVDC